MHFWRVFVGFKTGFRQGAASAASPLRVDLPASRQVSPGWAAFGRLPSLDPMFSPLNLAKEKLDFSGSDASCIKMLLLNRDLSAPPGFSLARRGRHLFASVRMALLVALGSSLPVSTQAETSVLDFPLRWEDPLPDWIPAIPIEWEDREFRRLDIPWAGVSADRRVLVSIVFREGESSRLSAYWVPEGSELGINISENLMEGIEGWNQRLLLLPPELTSSPGSLVLDSADSSRIVQRIIFQVLQPGQAFTLPAKTDDPLYASARGFYFQTDLEKAGGPPPPDAWFGQFSEAWLQEKAEPLEGGLEVAVDISPAPSQAILRFEINGRGTAPSIWVNGQSLAGVSLEIPSWRDPAYLLENHANDFVYAGWRAGWAALPAGLLRSGENTFTFHPTHPKDALRSSRLELFFPAPPASSDAAPLLQESNPDLPPSTDFPQAWQPDAPVLESEPPTNSAPSSSDSSLPLFRTSFY